MPRVKCTARQRHRLARARAKQNCITDLADQLGLDDHIHIIQAACTAFEFERKRGAYCTLPRQGIRFQTRKASKSQTEQARFAKCRTRLRLFAKAGEQTASAMTLK